MLYLGITVLMLLIAATVRLGSIENRALEYRGLAEGMRTLFFWRCSGVKSSVWVAFPSREVGALHWIRQAVRSIEFCQDCYLTQEKIIPHPEGANVAAIWWVDNQKNWFTDKELQNFFWYNIWKWASRLAIGAFICNRRYTGHTDLSSTRGGRDFVAALGFAPRQRPYLAGSLRLIRWRWRCRARLSLAPRRILELIKQMLRNGRPSKNAKRHA